MEDAENQVQQARDDHYADGYKLQEGLDLIVRVLKKNEPFLIDNQKYCVKRFGATDDEDELKACGINYCRDMCMRCKSCRLKNVALGWSNGLWSHTIPCVHTTVRAKLVLRPQ